MGDQIIVTTTDYLPSHSEQMTLAADAVGNKITLTKGLNFPHNAAVFNLSTRLPMGANLTDLTSVETRAAVGLLSRSISIVGEKDMFMDPFPPAVVPPNPDNPSYIFGGHVVIRQGFQQVQIQGVQFSHLGQGGG